MLLARRSSVSPAGSKGPHARPEGALGAPPGKPQCPAADEWIDSGADPAEGERNVAKEKRRSDVSDAIDEFETWGERAGEWLERDARVVFVAAIVVLVVFGGYGAWQSTRDTGEDE